MPRRRQLTGVAIAVVGTALLTAAMVPVRTHLDHAVVALALVLPVVIAASVGGVVPGLAAVLLGFLAYDFFFLPPYNTLIVAHGDEWGALVVYAVVMALVSRVVDRLWHAESSARQGRQDAAQLLDISELLVSHRPTGELFGIVVSSVRDAFDLDSAALLLPSIVHNGGSSSSLEVVAHAGRALSPAELDRLLPHSGTPASLRVLLPANVSTEHPAQSRVLEAVVLRVADRIVGLLAVVGRPLPTHRRELLGAFANHIALAIERAAQRDREVRLELLEQVDRHRRYLFGAVSHDLRTPLSTIKASASALLGSPESLSDDDRNELAGLIETQADRLERMVSNLMDMTRIQAGALVLERDIVSLEELFTAATEALGPAGATVEVVLPDEPVVAEADRTLLLEALVNVLENGLRFAPKGTAVELRGELGTGEDRPVRILVTDRGPGIPAGDRARLFEVFEQGADPDHKPSAGTGLGLSITRSFIEAHGGTIRIEDAEPGTRVEMALPLSPKLVVPAAASTEGG